MIISSESLVKGYATFIYYSHCVAYLSLIQECTGISGPEPPHVAGRRRRDSRASQVPILFYFLSFVKNVFHTRKFALQVSDSKEKGPRKREVITATTHFYLLLASHLPKKKLKIRL